MRAAGEKNGARGIDTAARQDFSWNLRIGRRQGRIEFDAAHHFDARALNSDCLPARDIFPLLHADEIEQSKSWCDGEPEFSETTLRAR